MAKACKCDPHELCEECPEWIFTLADLIMCMMGLFVLLWVLKPPPGEKAQQSDAQVVSDTRWLETVGEIRGGFGWVPDPNSADPVDRVILAKRARLAGPGEKGIVQHQIKGAEGTDPEVTTIRPSKESAVGGKLLFSTGDSTLTPQTIGMLDQIATQIRGHRNIVIVKGHTSLDDLPDAATAQQRMDLSLRRAQKVADYLITQGVSPDILRVQGCSTFEPVAQRAYDATQQTINRRVEVQATSTLVEELQDPPEKSSKNSASVQSGTLPAAKTEEHDEHKY